ncbi:Hypothetical predicted protein [Pelobates cultripes]|uniref:Uncharacterized protein n=1 Tax=Pelobates cultripes TaxID=61616 RepID=A0AAD1SJD4_PELCU|nr:Hypothetical predicted protein [Pelobates cultripes]
MGRRSQKPPPGANRDSLDISTMLQRPTASKMAIAPDSDNYLEDPEETSENVKEPQQTHYPTADRRENLNPATKQDIADSLQGMRQMHAADLDSIKTEIQAVTALTQASEEDIQDLRKEVQGLKETVQHLQTSTEEKLLH